MDMLERGPELSQVQNALEHAAEGSGHAVFIEGPAGIGKTRLLEAGKELASQLGLRVLAARGAELERGFTYGIVRQLIEPEVAAAGARERARLLEGPASHAGALFLDGGARGPPGEDTSFGVLHALFWLLARLGDRGPLALALDDLHWSDDSSLRFLDFLSRRLDDLPVALVATVRSSEPGLDARVLGSVMSEPPASVLQPPPLSQEACAELVRSKLSEAAEEFCRACHRATGGNPLLLRELIRAVAARGIAPDAQHADEVETLGVEAISRSVDRRLARQPAAVRGLAEAAAVLGDGAPLPQAARLAGLDDEAAYEAMGVLAGMELLRARSQVDFVHPVVQASVYEALGPARSRHAHVQAARVLREAGAGAEQVAAHLLLAPAQGDAEAVDTLREAARRSLASSGTREAVSYLRRALAEPPPPSVRADLLVEQGMAERLLDGPAAAEHLSEALELIDDPVRRASVTHSLAWTLFLCARPLEGAKAATAALEALGSDHERERRRLEAILFDIATMVPALNRLGRELDRRLKAAAEEAHTGARIIALLLAYRDARALALPAADAAGRVDAALADGGLLGLADATGAVVLGAAVLSAADSPAALVLAERAMAEARRRGSVLLLASATMVRAHAHLGRGDLAAAADDAQHALEAIGTYGVLGGAAPYATVPLAHALMERGDLDGAAGALERAGYRDELPDNLNLHGFVDCRIRLRLLRGDVRGALDETLESGRRFEALGGRNPALLPWRSRAALCLARLGDDPAESLRLALVEVDLAREWRAPRALGRALRAHGLVTGGEEGVALLREAVDVLDGTPARLEHAHALADLGAALRRANRRAEARKPLTGALRLARECGADALEARARDELVAAGGRPRTAALSGPDALTPSERRIAHMAASGLTNREIAERLFVTPKTVEAHLGHAYRKLDLHSRGQLAAALREREPGRRRSAPHPSLHAPG